MIIFADVQAAPPSVIENPVGRSTRSITPGNDHHRRQRQRRRIRGRAGLVMNAQTSRGVRSTFAVHHDGALLNAGMVDTTPLDDFNATYYFMWDDQFFYAAASAVDDNYSFVGPDPNGSDALQFVFAESPDVKDITAMYIPTIAPEDAEGNLLAKNDFGGWLAIDIMGVSTVAGKVNPDTSDWTVEVKIPWSAMTDFTKPVFPPKTGDMVGFVVLAIDYDNGTLEWFSCNESTFRGVAGRRTDASSTGERAWSNGRFIENLFKNRIGKQRFHAICSIRVIRLFPWGRRIFCLCFTETGTPPSRRRGPSRERPRSC